MQTGQAAAHRAMRETLIRAHAEAQARRFADTPSESARVLSLLAARRSPFPLVAANDEPRAPFGGDAA